MELLLNNTPILKIDSILKSGVIQSFNSIDKIKDEVKYFNLGNLYISIR